MAEFRVKKVERRIRSVEVRRKNDSEKTVDILCGGTKMTLKNYVLQKIDDKVIYIVDSRICPVKY